MARKKEEKVEVVKEEEKVIHVDETFFEPLKKVIGAAIDLDCSLKYLNDHATHKMNPTSFGCYKAKERLDQIVNYETLFSVYDNVMRVVGKTIFEFANAITGLLCSEEVLQMDARLSSEKLGHILEDEVLKDKINEINSNKEEV